jgi:hypothetical protein
MARKKPNIDAERRRLIEVELVGICYAMNHGPAAADRAHVLQHVEAIRYLLRSPHIDSGRLFTLQDDYIPGEQSQLF